MQARRDRFGRLLAYVTLPNRQDLGRRLLSGGFARVFVFRRPFGRVASYRAAEQAARNDARGLWSACVGGTANAAARAACPAPKPAGGAERGRQKRRGL